MATICRSYGGPFQLTSHGPAAPIAAASCVVDISHRSSGHESRSVSVDWPVMIMMGLSLGKKWPAIHPSVCRVGHYTHSGICIIVRVKSAIELDWIGYDFRAQSYLISIEMMAHECRLQIERIVRKNCPPGTITGFVYVIDQSNWIIICKC